MMAHQTGVSEFQDSQVFPFLRLPREIRDKVYRYALVHCPPLHVFTDRCSVQSSQSNRLPEICAANRLIYDELRLAHIRATTLAFSDDPDSIEIALRYIRSFPERTGFNAVRSLATQIIRPYAFGAPWPRAPHAIAMQCPGLARLRIVISTATFPGHGEDAELEERGLQIGRAFECKKLRKLELIITVLPMPLIVRPYLLPLTQAYGALLEKKNKESGGSVEVVVRLVRVERIQEAFEDDVGDVVMEYKDE